MKTIQITDDASFDAAVKRICDLMLDEDAERVIAEKTAVTEAIVKDVRQRGDAAVADARVTYGRLESRLEVDVANLSPTHPKWVATATRLAKARAELAVDEADVRNRVEERLQVLLLVVGRDDDERLGRRVLGHANLRFRTARSRRSRGAPGASGWPPGGAGGRWA